jgi:peptidoglycan/xylan/chitin deacetylase (PgdA/CDA1 family)
VPQLESRNYTTLKPFQELFETGLPILMYHKIGPRPRRVRIKGLYLSTPLLKKQLAELKAAGFNTPAYARLPGGHNKSRAINLSFDDGFANAFKNAMRPLADNQFRAIQFLVVARIGKFNDWEVQLGDVREPLMDTAMIRDWLAAGHEIGAHTLTHPLLTRLTLRDAREEIFASKKKLEDLFGVPVRHFSYPFGDRNEAIRDLVQEAGYETACTTEFGTNTTATPPLDLRRVMARHQTISIKSLKARLTKSKAVRPSRAST